MWRSNGYNKCCQYKKEEKRDLRDGDNAFDTEGQGILNFEHENRKDEGQKNKCLW